MSGHSKFANIKHKKEKNDAKKGKIFTIIGREIVIAVKEGGPDPANNSKLRDVIAKAKANNMPNDTIDRGIKKAAGDANADNYERITYEGYGPNGIAGSESRRDSDRQQEPYRSKRKKRFPPKETEALEHRDAYPTCSTKKARSSSTKKSAKWMLTI